MPCPRLLERPQEIQLVLFLRLRRIVELRDYGICFRRAGRCGGRVSVLTVRLPRTGAGVIGTYVRLNRC